MTPLQAHCYVLTEALAALFLHRLGTARSNRSRREAPCFWATRTLRACVLCPPSLLWPRKRGSPQGTRHRHRSIYTHAPGSHKLPFGFSFWNYQKLHRHLLCRQGHTPTVRLGIKASSQRSSAKQTSFQMVVSQSSFPGLRRVMKRDGEGGKKLQTKNYPD